MAAPVTPSSASMQAVLARMAAIQSRFSVQGGDGLPPMPGSPAPRAAGDESFAQSLTRASATTAATAPAPAETMSFASTRGTARTIGVALPGAGDVRGLSALATGPLGSGLPVGVGAGAAISDGAVPAPGGGKGAQAVAVAKEYLGVPYKWGGTTPAGFDCSGLVQHAYRRLGVELPRVSRDQARAGRPVASLAEAVPGDLVAFGHPVDHIGIYAGDNKMVVAPHTGAVVRVQDITRPTVAIRRVI